MHNEEVRGRVTVRVTVASEGAVSSAAILATTVNDARLEDCIVSAFRRWTFPAPAGGAPMLATYTFHFE
jgi:TonB family protein